MALPDLSNRKGVLPYLFVSLIVLTLIVLYTQTRLTEQDSPSVAFPGKTFLDQGGFALEDPPSIALLFQVQRELATASIWERWFRDAYDWIRDQRLEGALAGAAADYSKILRAFVNYSPAFKEEKVRSYMPPALESRLIPAPVDCGPDFIALCHYRLLLHAITTMPQANYFILISEDSIPLITFESMYKSLKSDRRIRTTLVHLPHGDLLPKTTPWKGEPREIVNARLSDLMWLQNTSSNHLDKCARDECWSWAPIVKRYGEDFDSKFYTSACLDSLSCFMLDCWSNMKICAESGDVIQKSPFKWAHLREDFLLTLLNDPNIWMLRRVSDDTSVGEARVILDVYLAAFFKSKHASYSFKHHPDTKQALPDRGEGQGLAEIIKLFRDNKVEGLDEGFFKE